ncbi:MAG: hypothetical protein WAT39_13020 [Planctomycetota bacterium]
MLATLLVSWCVGSFLAAPVIGRAIRSARRAEVAARKGQALEVA